MKISIAYKFVSGPFGGANQFLLALRHCFEALGVYEPRLRRADVVLANVNPSNLSRLARQLPRYRRTNPAGPIILRLDGPITLIRGHAAGQPVDTRIAELIRQFADGVIYQSNWSREQNHALLNVIARHETVIPNAPDPDTFYPRAEPLPLALPVRLMASSWSPNPRKGFAVYQYLDKNLDWSKYALTFVGNSPVVFKNIRTLPPLPSIALAATLRQHHLYLTASENDPCSNSLIEALACGLPAIVLNSGGHPELIQAGGVTFTSTTDVIASLEQAVQNYATLRARLPHFSITDTAKHYLAFAATLLHEQVRQRTP